jgi:hypothetical protein
MVGHDATLTGVTFAGRSSAPTIVRRSDREFIPAILAGLCSDDGRRRLSESVTATRDADHVLKLHQPVHQIFHVALLQIACDAFGTPRLDPAAIDSAGLVVRRVSGEGFHRTERWSKAAPRSGAGAANRPIVGWVACADDDLDPDPARRRPALSSGNAEIDRRLPLPAPIYDSLGESVAPLFVAPPEVCTAAAATVLYGLVPVTSTETSETPAAPELDDETARARLPYFVRAGDSRTIARADAGRALTQNDAGDASLAPFVNGLKQLQFELDAFGDSSEAGAIRQLLDGFDVCDADGNVLSSFGEFLARACAVLLDRAGGSVEMPDAWPEIDAATDSALTALARKVLETRLASILSGEARFEDASRLYRLRAFVRLKSADGCPPTLVWSHYSEPFRIAPWYEGAGLPPVRIQLPKLDQLQNLKPNVAFAMPEELFNATQADAAKTMRGESAGDGPKLGIAWICSFSIPIITICAFIVLNLFLSLFKIVFAWSMSLKICLPLPVPKGNDG